MGEFAQNLHTTTDEPSVEAEAETREETVSLQVDEVLQPTERASGPSYEDAPTAYAQLNVRAELRTAATTAGPAGLLGEKLHTSVPVTGLDRLSDTVMTSRICGRDESATQERKEHPNSKNTCTHLGVQEVRIGGVERHQCKKWWHIGETWPMRRKRFR